MWHFVEVPKGLSWMRAFSPAIESTGRTSRGDKWSPTSPTRGVKKVESSTQLSAGKARIEAASFLPLADLAAEAGFENRRDAFKICEKLGRLSKAKTSRFAMRLPRNT
jgi:hypothetical protein